MSEVNQKQVNSQQHVPERQPEMSWELTVRAVERRMLERAFEKIGQSTDVNSNFRDPQKAERFQFPEFKGGEVLKALNDLKQRGFKSVVVQSENPEFMRRVAVMTESLGMGTNVRLGKAEKGLVQHIREKNPWTLVGLNMDQHHHDHGIAR